MDRLATRLRLFFNHPAGMVCVVWFASCLVHALHLALADWGGELRSPYPVSDAFYYAYAGWYRAFVDPSGGYTAAFIANSPYVRFLTAGFRILGPGSATPFIVNALLMSGAAVFSALIAYRLYGTAAGWLCGFGFVLSGLIVFFAGLTVKTCAELFFIAGSAYFMIGFIQAPALWRWFLSLVLLGLAIVDRNNYMVVAPAYVFFAWRFALGGMSWVDRIWRLLLPAGLAMLLVGEVAGVRTDVVEQPFFSPVGLNVFIGNAPASRGTYTIIPDVRDDIEGQYLQAAGVAEKAAGRDLGREEVSLYWFRQAWEYYSERPLDYLVLQGRKAVLLIAAESYGLPEQYAVWKWQRPALILAPVSYSFVLALAIALFCCSRSWREQPAALLVFSSLFLYVVALWVFYVGERYRLPILMLLMPFAAQALVSMWRMSCWRQRLPMLTVVATVFLGSHAGAQILDHGAGWAQEPARVAASERKGREGLQEFYAAQELAVRDDDAGAWYALARYTLRRGFFLDAQQYAERAVNRAPDMPAYYGLLADIYQRRGLWVELEQLANTIQHRAAAEATEDWSGIVSRVDFLLRVR